MGSVFFGKWYTILWMKQKEKEIVAEYLSNIAVAWFAAGVIGIFIGGAKNIGEISISLLWGLILSGTFLYAGTVVLKGER